MDPGHKNTGTCHNNLMQDSRRSWCCMTCQGADIMLPEQVNVKLNLVEREIVTHKLGGKEKKKKKKGDYLIQLKCTLITVRNADTQGLILLEDGAWSSKPQNWGLSVFPNPQEAAAKPRHESSPELGISTYLLKALLVWSTIITIFVIVQYRMLQFRCSWSKELPASL